MDGFKPLGDAKDWHIWALLISATVGIISISYMIYKLIKWLINHVSIH